jgi:hypothetical protein
MTARTGRKRHENDTISSETIPYLLVEITVAGAIVKRGGGLLGDNVADATLQFGWRADDLPAALSDERVLETLRQQIGPILVATKMSMVGSGWVFLGETDEPITAASTPTGEVRRTDPVRVFIPMPGQEGQA